MIRSRTTRERRERRERVERIFRALPEVEITGAQHRAISVRKKRLGYYLNDHHGDGMVALAVKVSPGDLQSYLELDPARFFLPAYIGSRSFVGFRLDQSTVDWDQVETLARDAYRLQAPRMLVAQLEGAPARPRARASASAGRPKSRSSAASTLRRPLQPMPPHVRRALERRGLVSAYRARPPYQRNDYLAWIARAKRDDTRERRLAQMLDELEAGDRYMNMAHRGSRAGAR